jgi:hypothetical protein
MTGAALLARFILACAHEITRGFVAIVGRAHGREVTRFLVQCGRVTSDRTHMQDPDRQPRCQIDPWPDSLQTRNASAARLPSASV